MTKYLWELCEVTKEQAKVSDPDDVWYILFNEKVLLAE